MDMDSDIIQQPADTTELPNQIQPAAVRPKRPSTEEEQPQQPSGSKDIQMSVFKSNVSSSALDQPSTSYSRPSTSSGIHAQQPSTSFVRHMLGTLQAAPRNVRAPHRTHSGEMKDTLFSFSPETQRDSTDESDSEFSLFGQ